MAEFEVKVYPIRLESHPDPETTMIEIARIGDYRSIVRKGMYQDGDMVAYIPEASIVPDDILEEMELKGKLSGSAGNRVKAIRLRGVVSQGLVYPMPTYREGEEVSELLGITKYVPPIPANMAGEVWNAMGKTLHYDIENIKKYPDVLEEGEQVVATEKLHGTFCQMGFYRGESIVTSKGLGGRGLALKENEKNIGNLYVKMRSKYSDQLDKLRVEHGVDTFYVCGEIFGKGVQDLAYDVTEPCFRVFDVYVGERSQGRFLNYDEMLEFVGDKFETVPMVFKGKFSKGELVELMTDGSSMIARHMREGVVIKPIVERTHPELDRVILKSVSDKYLLRKGDTTEFE